MTGFLVDLVAYVAVCGLLSIVWALTSGSFEALGAIWGNLRSDPGIVRELGFWPVWVWIGWGAALVIHFGVALAATLSGGRRRRRRRKAEQAARRAGGVVGVDQAQGVVGRRPGPRGPARTWVTVMFTDVAESTRLNEALGDEEWSAVLARHRQAVRRALAAHGGKEVGTQGDGFLARFPTPADAVLCGVDIQRHLESTRSEPTALQVRIGIHAGEAVEDEGDLVGRVVNLAARVASTARPGEILVTEPVADHLGARLSFEDRGVRELKGIAQPRHLLAVVWSESGGQPSTAGPEGGRAPRE